ncbi:MAG: hypothetical protein JSR26_00200 [Proteobacteria bacterium]|nr:hypothetical protein [Pseudomonadota bacterium]
MFSDYFERISGYYLKTRTNKSGFSVERVAELFGSSTKNDGRDGEPSGRRDSLYWVNVGRERKVGFLEGFFSCRSSLGLDKSQWHKPVAWYISRLDTVMARNANGEDGDSSIKNLTIIAGMQELSRDP